jgi:pimeloyl-ACP methyl ester carboxylesterase
LHHSRIKFEFKPGSNTRLRIDIKETQAALQGEPVLQEFCNAQRPDIIKSDVPGLIEALSTLLPEVDREALLGNEGMGQFLVDTMVEGLKNNSDGWVDDSMAFTEPWGFDLGEIKVPVLLYQGSEDKMVPFGHGEWLAEHLPQEKLVKHLQPGQGHISIFLGQADSMVDELLANV